MCAATASASKPYSAKSTIGGGVKIALIDASRRNPFERRFRSFSAGLAPVIAPNGTLVMYSAALSLGRFRQWRRPQPVRAGIAEGNPRRSRPDGRRDLEPDPKSASSAPPKASRCRGFRPRWLRILPLSRGTVPGASPPPPRPSSSNPRSPTPSRPHRYSRHHHRRGSSCRHRRRRSPSRSRSAAAPGDA